MRSAIYRTVAPPGAPLLPQGFDPGLLWWRERLVAGRPAFPQRTEASNGSTREPYVERPLTADGPLRWC